MSGQLGQATGLSPAAITALLDRLEQAGVAERRPDATDRRRVLVVVSAGASRVAAMYNQLEHHTRRRIEHYTPREQTIIARFLRDMYEIGVDHVARLEQPAPRP